MQKLLNTTLDNLYLDWVNNFISYEGFALWYGITPKQAETLLDLAREMRKERDKREKLAKQAAYPL